MKPVQKLLLAVAVSYGLYEGVNFYRRNQALAEAGKDPAVLQAVALHDALTASGGKLLKAILTAASPGAAGLLSIFSPSATKGEMVKAVLDQVTDLDAVRARYQELYGKNLDAQMLKVLGVEAVTAINNAATGAQQNTNAVPDAQNVFVPNTEAKLPYIGAGMKSSVFVVAKNNGVELYQRPIAKTFTTDHRIYYRGSTFTVLRLNRSDMAGYATGRAEKDKDGTIWIQVGKRSLNPTATWWVKRADVDVFPNYASAKASHPKINKTLLKQNGLDLLEGTASATVPPLVRYVTTTASATLVDGEGNYLDTAAPGLRLGILVDQGYYEADGQTWVVVENNAAGRRTRFAVRKSAVTIQ